MIVWNQLWHFRKRSCYSRQWLLALNFKLVGEVDPCVVLRITFPLHSIICGNSQDMLSAMTNFKVHSLVPNTFGQKHIWYVIWLPGRSVDISLLKVKLSALWSRGFSILKGTATLIINAVLLNSINVYLADVPDRNRFENLLSNKDITKRELLCWQL